MFRTSFCCLLFVLLSFTPDDTRADEIFSKQITVFGQARDVGGKPVSGATIYIASNWATYELLATTTTDQKGNYRFEDLELPIKQSKSVLKIASGRFEVFGTAKGYAFAWRGTKRVYANRIPSFGGGNKNEDGVFAFTGDDPIQQDLEFAKPVPFSGHIVDVSGEPIANAKITLFNAETLNKAGYDSSHDFLVVGDRDFSVLYMSKISPEEIRQRFTDQQGRFEFDNVPPNSKFRIFIKPKGYATRSVFASTGSRDLARFDDVKIEYTGMELAFEKNKRCEVTAIYGDTKEPAKNVYIELSNKNGRDSAVSNAEGKVKLDLPPGEYRVGYLVEYGTPYISRYSVKSILNHQIDPEKADSKLTIELEPAATLEVEVVDAHIGRPIADVDFWISDGDGRTDYFWRSWKPPNISMVDRPKTPRDGKVKLFLKPGEHTLGAGYQFIPKRYLASGQGHSISIKAGETQSIQFKLKRRGVKP